MAASALPAVSLTVAPSDCPSLPFVLPDPLPPARVADTAPPNLADVLSRIVELEASVLESRRSLDSLYELNLAIMRKLDSAKRAEDSTESLQEEQRLPPLALRLLGSLQVVAAGQPVSRWPSKKARLLLAYLGMERGRMVPKDVLIELFWPDATPERGSNNLSIAIHQVRSTLAEANLQAAKSLVVKQGQYGLDPRLVNVDLWAFQESLAEARRALASGDDQQVQRSLTAAIELFQGELLESDPYEDWAVGSRRSCSAAYVQALGWLTKSASAANAWAQVIDYAGRLLRLESCDEEAHRWLMLAYWKMGNRPQAIQQYQVCEERLRTEMAVQPSEQTRRLYALVLS